MPPPGCFWRTLPCGNAAHDHFVIAACPARNIVNPLVAAPAECGAGKWKIPPPLKVAITPLLT